MNINWIQKLKIALASLALLGLTACGGAGGGGGGIPASASQTISATMQAGTIAVNNTEVGGTMTVSTDNIGQRVLTVQNAGNKLLNAQIGQVMVFEGSAAMPLGFAGIVQSVQTVNVNGIPTTTATFAPANISNVFQNLNLNMSNVTPNPQLMAGVALQNGVRTYTRTEPQASNVIQNGLIDFTPILKQTNSTIGVDFSNGIKISLWKVNGQWVDTDPNKPVPKVVITYTGQIELQNPSFSQVNVVIENGKLVTHDFKLKGTLKRNIKVAATGNAQITAAELGGWFGKGSPYYKNGTYNEISFDYKGSTVKVRGIEKDPSKILIGAVILGVNGIIPTYGNSQTGNVLKTVPVGLVVKFFMSGDVTAETTASVGYQWRDMDINTGVGLSYDDTLGLPVSLLTGNTKMPTPFWDAKAHLDQPEGVSYTVSGKASVTLTAGFDAGIVLTGLELAQASVEGGIRGSFSGQFDQPLGKALTGCYSSASVTAGVRSILDVAAGVELKTNFQNKWVTWMNTAVKSGFVYRFPMYPAEGVDYLTENTIWSVGDDTCHIPRFNATAGTGVYDYNFDAKATAYQPLVSDYTWDFGDGTTTSGVAATHTYSAAGNYAPKLTVLFSDGVQKTISQPITVAAVPTLTPVFTTSFNGLKASFDATTSTPSANITSYLWNFGDGTTASGNVSSHLYAAYSNTPWSVTLTVTDSYGRTASTSQNVTATCPTGQVLQNGQCAVPAPSVTNVSPPIAALNTPTTLTVTGTNLPLTAVLSMADAVCQTPTNRAASGFTVSCTPQGTATGVKVITVKTDTLANGGTVIDATKTVTVSAAVVAALPKLFPTGVDALGNALAAGSPDPHYTILSPNQSGVVMNADPAWIPDSPTSMWIWETSSGQPTFVTRTFRTTVDLTGLNPNLVSVLGTWATDNGGIDILINGVSTGNTCGGFQAYCNFAVNSGFVAGVNTLDFVVTDVGVVSGFRVDTIGIVPKTPTPNPFIVAANDAVGTAFNVPSGATSCLFNATGTWNWGLGQVDANGMIGTLDPASVNPLASVYSLIAKMSNGAYQAIGASQQIPVSSGSVINFMMNDGYFLDNTGAVSVTWSCQ